MKMRGLQMKWSTAGMQGDWACAASCAKPVPVHPARHIAGCHAARMLTCSLAPCNSNTGAQGGLSFRSGAGQVAFNSSHHNHLPSTSTSSTSSHPSGPWPSSSDKGPTGSHREANITPVALASGVPFNQPYDTRGPSQFTSMVSVDTTSAMSKLRTGHSNGHGTHKRNIVVKNTKSPLHGGLVYGSGGTGSAGGLSFRSGGGQVSFRGPRHAPLTSAVHRQAAQGGSGNATFRQLGGCVSFRTASTASTSAAGDVEGSTAVNAEVQPEGGLGSLADALQALQQHGTGKKGKQPGKLERMAQQLQEYGVAGVVAYGLLNTLWYTIAFISVWLVSGVPRGQGIAVAAQTFLTTMAVVWAGSQVTKVARAGGALLLAPIVDRGLTWLQHSLKLPTKQKAFVLVLTSCLTIALTLFATVVLAWA